MHRKGHLLSGDWEPKEAADRVLERLVQVTPKRVKGAHDSEMALTGDYAYIVAEVNELRPGESPDWPEIYSSLSVVNLNTLEMEAFIPFARSAQVYDNETLPEGQCFVPRIIRKNASALRCYFASQNPGRSQSQIWFIDFDIASRTFENRIFKAKLKTDSGVFDMQPRHLHADAAAHGFTGPDKDHGLYIFDAFKRFDGRLYAAINNFPAKQNALTIVRDSLDTFEILGHYFEPQDGRISESAVNRLPDGTWMGICRQDGGDNNYLFTVSRDGRKWSVAAPREFVAGGRDSKPTFDRFGELYYLGWQDATRINGVRRSVFNIDVSRDCERWERRYRFETDCSFQYPTFREHNGAIYLTATQGEPGFGGKTRIMFGRLEDVGGG